MRTANKRTTNCKIINNSFKSFYFGCFVFISCASSWINIRSFNWIKKTSLDSYKQRLKHSFEMDENLSTSDAINQLLDNEKFLSALFDKVHHRRILFVLVLQLLSCYFSAFDKWCFHWQIKDSNSSRTNISHRCFSQRYIYEHGKTTGGSNSCVFENK